MGNGNDPTKPGSNPTPGSGGQGGSGGGGSGGGTKPGGGGSGVAQPASDAEPPQPKRLLRAAGTGGFIGGLIGGLIGACICCFLHR
jgi:hypothetical protein